MPVRPTKTSRSELKTADLGDLPLENGETLRDLRMSYVTVGELNTDRSNAILCLHGLIADHTQLLTWATPGGVLDTDRYCVILPDTLGVVNTDPAASSSPTRSGLKMDFPRYTIRDMVAAEHLLLTKALGLDHVVAVTGASMGGIAALQWAVSFPEFMDAVIPVTTQARASRQTSLLWEACRRAIMLDPKWRDGAYAETDVPRDGTIAGLMVQSLFGGSALGFERRFDSAASIDDFFAEQSTTLATNCQARDWVYRTWALDVHDIAGTAALGGDLAKAAASIKARLLMVVNRQDQLLPPFQSGVVEVARHTLVCKVVDFDSPSGHYAHRDPLGMALIATEIGDLLTRTATGKPGFTGHRFPASWSQSDITPDEWSQKQV